MPVSLSSDVLPELREYERTVTTVANGYVQPQVKRYVETLAGGLRESGVAGELAILRSDGGLSAAEAAVGAPVTMLLSGPAGGVTGAVWIAEQCGYADLITFDMGGTSTDVALVQGLTPADRARDEGRRPHRSCVQCGRPHGRRGRRLDRARAGADQGAARRPAVRGRRPRPRRVRQGRHRADRHRRQRGARLPPAVARGRRDHARRRRRPGRRADRRRRDGPGVRGGRGGGHRRHRQREHARRPAAGLGAAGLRPARLRARRVRRRGPAARQRAGQADRGVAGDRAAVAGRAVRAGRRDDVRPQRVGPHRAAPLRRPRRRRPARRSSTSSPPRRVAALAEQGVPAEQQTTAFQVDVRYHGQGFEIPIEVEAPDLEDARRPRSTPSTSGFSRSCSPSTTSWSTPARR